VRDENYYNAALLCLSFLDAHARFLRKKCKLGGIQSVGIA
jgi:hypothetical protein